MLNKCNPYHSRGIMINNIPFSRKEVSTFLTLSAAIALLLSSTLVLFNLLLQPVLAQSSTLSFRTTQTGADGSLCTHDDARLTFDAQGTASSSNPQHVDITSGTFQVTNSSGGILYSGNILTGSFTNNTSGGSLGLTYGVNRVPSGPTCVSTEHELLIDTGCSTTNFNDITTRSSAGNIFGDFTGAVECSQGGGGDTTQSSMTGTAQGSDSKDGDGDGISDSSDKCVNHSNPRCYIDAR
jgi:hypothetical protein